MSILLLVRPSVTVTTTVWDDSPIGTGIVLSNGNLTATRNIPYSGSTPTARTVGAASTGKYYASFQIGDPGLAWVGFCNSNLDLDTADPQSSPNALILTQDGEIAFDGNFIADGEPYGTDGDYVEIAVDFDAQLVWFRVNGGVWNDGLGVGDPEHGTGGTSFAGLNPGPYYLMASIRDDGTSWTANFGATAYTYAPPVGFANWPTTADANQYLFPSLYTDADTFYGHVVAGVTQTLTQNTRFDDLPDTFYGHTVAGSGAAALTQNTRYDNLPDTFYGHVVTGSGAVTLTQNTRYDNLPDTFYGHVVTATGAATLTPARFDDLPDTFYGHTVAIVVAGGLTQTARYDNLPDTFYGHTVAGSGSVTLTQTARFDDLPDIFYGHVVTGSGSAALTQAARYDNLPDTFYAHVVAGSGSVTLTQTARFDDLPDTFYGHTVALTGPATITPQRYVDPDIFYAHTVAIFYDDTEVICARYEDRRMSALADYRWMIVPAEDTTMGVPGEDHAMDSYPRRRAC